MDRPQPKSPAEYARARVDALIAERFRSSSMSDAKWVRLLDALTAREGLVAACRVKLVWDDELRTMNIDGADFDFDYYAHAMEAMISGAPLGWYAYKEVEWLEFPVEGQDVARIGSVIRSVGQFDLEWTEVGLRLYAYR